MSPSEIGEPKYLLLTTFRRDGTGVPTPVWCVRVSGELRVITQADSGKVRRIRTTDHVLVGPCDARGRPRGPQVSAKARLLEGAEIEETARAIGRRYGLLGRILLWRQRRRAARSGHEQGAAIVIDTSAGLAGEGGGS
jgi:PPOX class probable F420-dependent enzyme